MSRELSAGELEAALKAVTLLTDAQNLLPEGWWFSGTLNLCSEAGTYGEFRANDFDSFDYTPEAVIQ